MFCWVTLGYDGSNQPMLDARRPRVLWKWIQNDASAAADSKTTMMFHLREKVTLYFGRIFQTLLVALHAFLSPRIRLKIEQMDDYTIPRKHLLDLIEPAKADYATVLGFIDQAIVDLDLEILNDQPITSITPTPVTPTRITQPLRFRDPPSLAHSHSGSSLKRQAEGADMLNGSPKSKKQKQREYENEWHDSRVFERLSNPFDYTRASD